MIESNRQTSYVITGASSYLGKAFAKQLLQNKNSRILLTSRSEIAFEEEKKIDEILANKNICYLPNIDLIKESDLNTLKNKANDFLNDKFHVINCVGYFPGYYNLEEMSVSTAQKVFNGNILTLYGVANKLIPLMRERGGGHFIGFSTHTSYQDYPQMVAFTAVKEAVVALIKGISNEYIKDGIVANTIALATLLTKAELPYGDHENWLETKEVCDIVENLIHHSNNLINGTTLHMYKYSETYFAGYFDRIRSKEQ